MEARSASFPSLFWPLNLGQSNFKLISRSEESGPCPIPGLAEEILHMRVKEGSKIHNLLRFATARMEAEDANKASQRQVVFSGSGGGVTKTITCVELMKRRIGGLHQVSKLHYKTVTEIWERTQQGVPGLSVKKTVPAIWILLSKDPLDAQEPGYQPPQTLRVPAEDGERGLRMLLQPALGPPAKFTAKKACPDYWSACSPHSG
ncbi:ribonuclease P protein subunit p25-like protein [Takifugu flavidus]|uniref:ribonuclease P protein subunit p25-like protein n=1 Tax=Takifugu flavidus TaxID=433684 RepID=UPI00254416C3|nr:ribonuclease P protein subunit p25-like protein [Takifugu flavidus]